MADLINIGSEISVSEWVPTFDGLRLYCWPCGAVHEFEIPDVERIVYALGAAEVLATHMQSETFTDQDRADAREMANAGTTCLATILDCSHDPEVFAEHVEQGVECREAAP